MSRSCEDVMMNVGDRRAVSRNTLARVCGKSIRWRIRLAKCAPHPWKVGRRGRPFVLAPNAEARPHSKVFGVGFNPTTVCGSQKTWRCSRSSKLCPTRSNISQQNTMDVWTKLLDFDPHSMHPVPTSSFRVLHGTHHRITRTSGPRLVVHLRRA